MRRCIAWFLLVFFGLGIGVASAQQSTTVQLPTYSFFTTNSTVSVPDRGSAYLGGVSRAASGRNEFGSGLLPFRNRSFGTERSASNASVSVYIHDFEAMDEYLLSRPTSGRSLEPLVAGQQPATGRFAAPARDVPRRPRPFGGAFPLPTDGMASRVPGGAAAMSVEELRAERVRLEKSRGEEALKWLERGRTAEASGKTNVARVYYQMAARRATGDLKDQIAVRLEAVGGSSRPPKLAQSRP